VGERVLEKPSILTPAESEAWTAKWPYLHRTRCSASLMISELHIETIVKSFPDLKWRHKDSTTSFSQKSSKNN